MTAIVVVLWLAAVAVLWPSLVFLIECICARTQVPSVDDSGPRPRIAVLVPAHDEEGDIASTVLALRTGLVGGDRLLVVADNCGDGTAAAAAAAAFCAACFAAAALCAGKSWYELFVDVPSSRPISVLVSLPSTYAAPNANAFVTVLPSLFKPISAPTFVLPVTLP